MAYTVTKLAQTVFGNKRLVIHTVTADAATEAINTGLQNVDYAILQSNSMASGGTGNIKFNANASGVAAAGYVGVSGVAVGDLFTLFCFGS